MQINCVMLNNHDVLNLIEDYLDKANIEYQSIDNRIEVYQLDRQLIIIEIDDGIFSILYKKNKYSFEEFNSFFSKLAELTN